MKEGIATNEQILIANKCIQKIAKAHNAQYVDLHRLYYKNGEMLIKGVEYLEGNTQGIIRITLKYAENKQTDSILSLKPTNYGLRKSINM